MQPPRKSERWGYPRFQSSLELSPECNNIPSVSRLPSGEVSILTRAFARVQLGVHEESLRREISFNPHSSFRPSATRASWTWAGGSSWFQSSLELSPECNHEVEEQNRFVAVSFNPHSSFRPSATPKVGQPTQAQLEVSILTRAFARVQRGASDSNAQLFVFQSSLELSPECNRTESGRAEVGTMFQSSLELSPECNS